MELNELLKFLRGDRSLREIQKFTGISNAYWSQLENNKIKSPSVATVKTLMNCFPNHKSMILKACGLDAAF